MADWSDEEKATLRKLFGENLGDAEIAGHLPGRSLWQVKRQRGKESLHRRNRPWTDEEVLSAQRLQEEGLTVREIAEALGRSPGSVNHGLRKVRGTVPDGAKPLPPLPADAEPVTDPYEVMGLPGGLRAERTGPGRYELGVALRLDGRPVRDE